MNIQELTKHPERLNKDTLYELRRMTALYPYYQPARLLMLKNLYILHDPTFDEELRKASVYFTDRRILFNLVEQAHYRLKNSSSQSSQTSYYQQPPIENAAPAQSRTVSLIDSFLNNIPETDNSKASESKSSDRNERELRKPTAADATVDYVAYLLSTDFEELCSTTEEPIQSVPLASTNMSGGALIDAFISNENGKLTLKDEPQYLPEVPIVDNNEKEPEEEYLTETLAGIYIKQGRYRAALDIMERLSKKGDKPNIYYEDQKRFLAKLIANQS